MSPNTDTVASKLGAQCTWIKRSTLIFMLGANHMTRRQLALCGLPLTGSFFRTFFEFKNIATSRVLSQYNGDNPLYNESSPSVQCIDFWTLCHTNHIHLIFNVFVQVRRVMAKNNGIQIFWLGPRYFLLNNSLITHKINIYHI